MGIEAAVAASAISAGANLLGSSMDRRAGRSMARDANMQAQQRTDRALGVLRPAYEQAEQSTRFGFDEGDRINQEALERAMMMRGSTFMPQMQAFEGGNLAAQEANLASLPAMRAAILGGTMPPMMQAQSLPLDMSALEGLINPQAQQFRQMPNQQMMQPNTAMRMQRGMQGGMQNNQMFDGGSQMQFDRIPMNMR
jgi:hypothetical protein